MNVGNNKPLPRWSLCDRASVRPTRTTYISMRNWRNCNFLHSIRSSLSLLRKKHFLKVSRSRPFQKVGTTVFELNGLITLTFLRAENKHVPLVPNCRALSDLQRARATVPHGSYRNDPCGDMGSVLTKLLACRDSVTVPPCGAVIRIASLQHARATVLHGSCRYPFPARHIWKPFQE